VILSIAQPSFKKKNMKQKSVMKHQFSQVPKVSTPRSTFNRTHSHKTTFDGGKLIPFYVDEVLPGDTFNVNANLFGRLATPIVPVMDNIYLDTHYFYVPNRLVWDNFKKFMGEQENPEDSTDYLVPQITANYSEGSLGDYFGLPTNIANISANSLFFRAYNLIWNEWFRDQNLQDSVIVNKGDSGDLINQYEILRRGKRHDYFTSALPWPQKGPGVELPLGSSAPITGTGSVVLGNSMPIYGANDGNTNYMGTSRITSSGHDIYMNSPTSYVAGTDTNLQVEAGTLAADLSSATAATINSLRQAFQLQRLAEKDARGGTRYTEIVRSHFNVTSPDARLQRPEFLGGRTSRLDITPVAQTNATGTHAATGETPQGNLAGFGTVAQTNDGFTKSFTEHGIIIGLCSVRADLTYQKGVNRMFSRRTKYDYYWPTLAHLGEQEILNKEIYAQGTSSDDDVFGYQERWAEYRYYPSKITGKFRSDAAQSLDVWHQSQDFASLPQLNSTFIEDNPPLDRLSAVTTEPHILLDSHIEVRTARAMPTYSVPGLIDHL
jgi:hypothetical protein